VGGIDAHTFDPGLFLGVASRLPGFRFVLVGACSLPSGWCDLRNVHLLGRKPYEAVASYMSACDALIMPWNRSEWIRACNPIKLKEYLAVGKPVVSTPYPQLGAYADLVRIAPGVDSFARHVAQAISSPHDPTPGRRRIASDSWRSRAICALEALAGKGVRPESRIEFQKIA